MKNIQENIIPLHHSYKSLLYIEEKVEDISSKIEDKKNKVNWQKLFEK